MKSFLAASAIALTLATPVLANYQPTIDTSNAPAGRDLATDVDNCNLKAQNDPSNAALRSSVIGTAVNAAIGAVITRNLSPYAVTGVAQGGANVAINSQMRTRHIVDMCMRQKGWEVY